MYGDMNAFVRNPELRAVGGSVCETADRPFGSKRRSAAMMRCWAIPRSLEERTPEIGGRHEKELMQKCNMQFAAKVYCWETPNGAEQIRKPKAYYRIGGSICPTPENIMAKNMLDWFTILFLL